MATRFYFAKCVILSGGCRVLKMNVNRTTQNKVGFIQLISFSAFFGRVYVFACTCQAVYSRPFSLSCVLCVDFIFGFLLPHSSSPSLVCLHVFLLVIFFAYSWRCGSPAGPAKRLGRPRDDEGSGETHEGMDNEVRQIPSTAFFFDVSTTVLLWSVGGAYLEPMWSWVSLKELPTVQQPNAVFSSSSPPTHPTPPRGGSTFPGFWLRRSVKVFVDAVD